MTKEPITLIISILVVVTISYYFYTRYTTNTPTAENKPIQVSILLSSGMYYHEKAYEGFINRYNDLHLSKRYQFTPFFFRGLDKISISSMAQAAIDSQPDILVSVGAIGSQALAELREKRKCTIPHIFIGVTKCIELGLVQSLSNPGTNCSGIITGGYDPLIMPKLLYAAKPTTKRVLIPYDSSNNPDGLSTATSKAAQEYFATHDIKTTILPIDGMADAVTIINNALHDHDVLMGLEIDSFVTLSPAFVKICREKGVTFFAGSVEAADENALFSFGSQPLFAGAAGFDLIRKVIEKQRSPSTLPVVRLDNNRQFIINTTYACEQGIPSVDVPAIKERMEQDQDLRHLASRIKTIP